MANTFIHKFEGKYKNNLINDLDIPLNLKKKWNRHNFDGSFKNFRNVKKYKYLKKDVINEIFENKNIEKEYFERYIDFYDGCNFE